MAEYSLSSLLLLTATPAVVAFAVGFSVSQVMTRRREREAHEAVRGAELAKVQALDSVAANAAAKDRFFAALNHEARTPLNGVAGMAALLLEQPLSPETRQSVEAIRASSEALLTTLDDLVDLSRLEAGQWESRPTAFSPAGCLGEVTAVLAAQARSLQKRFVPEIRASVPAWARGDAARLRQVLLQVGSHALARTPHGEVRLAAYALPLDEVSQQLVVSVSDHGDASTKVPNRGLFEALARPMFPGDRTTPGPDVGLMISRLVCERLGGRIQLETELNGGSAVRLSLKLEIAEQAPEPTAAPAASAMRTCAMLLVEDNPVNQKVAVGMLGQLGCKPDLAVNGQEAVDAAVRRAYDVILMDVQMPVMDGIDATKHIVGGRHLGPRPWIIAVTANTLPGDRELCLRAGMNDYVAKPLKLPLLREAIERGLTAKSAHTA